VSTRESPLKSLSLILASILASRSVSAQPMTQEDIRLRLTMLDTPFHFDAGATPSMHQSLDVAYDIHRSAAYGMQPR
jgi:hypothetical protein